MQQEIERKTMETTIRIQLDLKGRGEATVDTQVPFLDHMLRQLTYHSLMDLVIHCRGDKEIDDHHIVEDVGICLGQILNQALGEKKGIARYGFAYAPLDESLSRAVVDISGRPSLSLRANWSSIRVGSFDTQLVREFFQAFVNHAGITLHLDCLYGINCHHQIESLYKAFALALRMAITKTARKDIPSTKGVL